MRRKVLHCILFLLLLLLEGRTKKGEKGFVGSGVYHILSKSSSTSSTSSTSSSSSPDSLILIKLKYQEIPSALCVKGTRENSGQLIQRRVEQ